MKRTKSQYRRLIQVLELIKSGRQHVDACAAFSKVGGHRRLHNCETMAIELEVSSKTIQRDIDFLRDELRVPVEYDVGLHGYYLSEPDFCLSSGIISEHSLDGLILCEQILSSLGLAALAGNLGILIDQACGASDADIAGKRLTIGSRIEPRPKMAPGIENGTWEAIQKGLAGCYRLLLSVDTGEGEHPEIFRFDPYRLILSGHECFVAGMQHVKGRASSPRTVPLGGITEASVMSSKFSPDTGRAHSDGAHMIGEAA